MRDTKLSRRRSAGTLFLRAWLAIAFVLVFSVAGEALSAEQSGEEFFERTVRPIFVERCQKCHGAQKQWSGFRLDSREAAVAGGDYGPALIAGKPDDSEIVRRVTDTDDDVRMPPPEEGRPLGAEQIAAIKKWIELGAPWPASAIPTSEAKEKLAREHWAFQPLTHPDPPAVQKGERARNPVDQFVIHRLENAGLSLAPEADRHTLIRRATYDLTGLPPSSEEIAEFVRDERADAYERLIDRLLESPRYGEHWGRHWLDIARYADTKGYVYTREQRFFVHSSLYRDWVIAAFNKDLPYDRFIVLQLAADQAAADDPNALAAMGFLTLGRRMLGVTPDVIEDRIDMVGRGLLGLTIGCARCHDHKFDPIPTADYYSLYGVFQNCSEREVVLPGSSIAARSKAEAALKKLQAELAETQAKRGREASDQVRARVLEYLQAQRALDNYPDLGVIPVTGKGELLPGFVRRWEAYLKEAAKANDPVFVIWTAYSQVPTDKFSSEAADVAARLAASSATINPRVAEAFATPPASADEVAQRYAQLFGQVNTEWTNALSAARAANQPPPQSLPDPADEALRQVLYGENSPCVIPDEPIVNTEYLWNLSRVEEIWKLQSKVDNYLRQHADELPCATVLADRQHLSDQPIFRRGNPMNKGDIVPRQFLEVVAGPERQPFKRGSGRFELAKAIVDPTNPLTARVWVNRVWLHHFDAGLVATPSDFGVRSSPPSHPELLDWLASEFMQRGWSTKWLHRMIMTSAAYRQTSQVPAAVLSRAQERDPDNRLLWRMNPHRLTFEQYRDTLLATSGELDLAMGGKAADLVGFRRSVYVLVDRQYLSSLFNVFDFASPDFHSAQRSETTTPQQALYTLNNPYVADRARKIASRIAGEADTPEARTKLAFQVILQRDPTPIELRDAVRFLAVAQEESPERKIDSAAWTYGYGEVDLKAGEVKRFKPLPHFTGSAWQGGSLWPDRSLGWAQLTAKGGHPGNDLEHAVIRRWTANYSGVVSIKSQVAHQDLAGDGITCRIISSRSGIVGDNSVHNERKELDVDSLAVEQGDTIDFVVDRRANLDSDEFVWIPTITEIQDKPVNGASSTSEPQAAWNSENDFPRVRLLPLEQLAQALLCSNEVMFVD
jgi:mono/diheme cytochrome c family protein